MSTNFTPADLVKLAVYCGKKVQRLGSDVVLPFGMGTLIVKWQPHLPEGAVQRDELVEVLVRAGYRVDVETKPAQTKHGIWLTCSVAMDGRVVGQHSHTTPGAAVCRAAGKVIGGTDAG